jgi:hypothetical protein
MKEDVMKISIMLEQLKKDEVFWFMLALSFLVMTSLILSAVMPKPVHAAEIPDNLAVRAIIGEAASEGYHGMLAVACGIRNRGTLKGVYGLNAKHVDHEPAWVWDLARKAWAESATKDIVNGSGDWESIDYPRPYWAKGMIITTRIGKHLFYVRKGDTK